MPRNKGQLYEGILKGKKVICFEDKEGKIRCLDKKKMLEDLPEDCFCD